MRTIYKYVLSGRANTVPVSHAKPLHVGLDPQRDICIWFDLESDLLQLDSTILLVGTGQRVPPGKYCGTVVKDDMVWHVYWRKS